ncbi:MAG TPA: methyltransferase domain-containing protein [Candidatus Dormibacteraeota bacterium]
MKSKEFFPSVFSRHAAAYKQRLDDIMARGESRGRTRLLELAEPRPGMRILDLACGPGNLSRRLAAMVSPGGDVVGVDLAPGMIALATEAGIPNAKFLVMDIERLEFADALFDAAVCGHGLQFAPNLGRALHEARRVLRPGGRFAASVPASLRGGSAWTSLDSVIDRWLPPAPKVIDQQATRATVADAGAFRQAALDAGFASANVEQIDEDVHWESAAQMVSMLMSWWDCASRLEGTDPARRQAFMTDAIETLGREHPGPITTTGRNLVLLAVA